VLDRFQQHLAGGQDDFQVETRCANFWSIHQAGLALSILVDETSPVSTRARFQLSIIEPDA